MKYKLGESIWENFGYLGDNVFRSNNLRLDHYFYEEELLKMGAVEVKEDEDILHKSWCHTNYHFGYANNKCNCGSEPVKEDEIESKYSQWCHCKEGPSEGFCDVCNRPVKEDECNCDCHKDKDIQYCSKCAKQNHGYVWTGKSDVVKEKLIEAMDECNKEDELVIPEKIEMPPIFVDSLYFSDDKSMFQFKRWMQQVTNKLNSIKS